MPGYPPSSHYVSHPGPYYPTESGPPAGANSSGSGYRERYRDSGSSGDWAGRDREFDYRRPEYDRRAPPPSGAS